MTKEKTVLESRLAGRWYTGEASALAREIDGYLASVEGEADVRIGAVIVPHAGYAYSARVAAAALKRVDGAHIRRVVAIGPSHRVALRNRASLPAATHIATPLGEVALDTAGVERLLSSPFFISVPSAHEQEHSVQIQLPLLQRALPGGFEFLPLVVGQLDLGAMRAMAAELRPLLDAQTLLVISTDFTHYGRSFDYTPFRGERVQEQIEELDQRVFEPIRNKDLARFWTTIEATHATVCGRCAVGVLLALLPEEAVVEQTAYDTSGRQTEDPDQSVSYVSAIVRVSWGSPAQATHAGGAAATAALSAAEQQALLKLARATVERAVRRKHGPALEELGIELTPGLVRQMGGFVTLKQQGRLRGCIGEIMPRRAIWEVVSEQAANAAMRDPRFSPVSLEEVAGLTIEISAMTPPSPIATWQEFEVGRHGIVLEKSGRSAVFLPQVAPEQGWDAGETLTHLALKAGLPPDAWREGARFEVFEAQVFHEE